MNLFIQLKDGLPTGHPLLEDNVKDAYEVEVIDDAFLAANNLARFEQPLLPAGIIVVNSTGYKLDDDGVVRPVVETKELTQDEKVEYWVRRPRNFELAQSDWTQMPDSPLSTAKKAEWAAYRQELRDMTTVYADIQDPAEIVPPTKPE